MDIEITYRYIALNMYRYTYRVLQRTAVAATAVIVVIAAAAVVAAADRRAVVVGLAQGHARARAQEEPAERVDGIPARV